MPELPDITVYAEALQDTVVGRRLRRLAVRNPFVLRSVTPPPEALIDQTITGVSRLGKRIVLGFGDAAPDGLYLVIHLMIAGRLRWRAAGATSPAAPSAKLTLAVLEFDHGRLFLTEAGSTRRASIRVAAGREALAQLDPGGVDPLTASPTEFRAALSRDHTLKRALTDPHLVSGIGNAYSDEILHAARLSPLTLTRRLTDEEWQRLYDATQTTLRQWIARLRTKANGMFPEKVTAFHDGMAVHGRFKAPCPVCGAPVQRIVYADNECNYCARCQTGGRVLADRALSRLLKEKWPRTLE